MSDIKPNTETLLLFGGVAAALYFLWPTLKTIGSGVSAVTGAITHGEEASVTSLANYYAALTGAGQTVPTGIILMPDGTTLPVSQLVGNVHSTPGSNTAQFVYNGTTFYLCGHSDANGNWAAQSGPCSAACCAPACNHYGVTCAQSACCYCWCAP